MGEAIYMLFTNGCVFFEVQVKKTMWLFVSKGRETRGIWYSGLELHLK